MTGLEPATSGVTGRCSNQLSYIPNSKHRFGRASLIMHSRRVVSRVRGVALRLGYLV